MSDSIVSIRHTTHEGEIIPYINCKGPLDKVTMPTWWAKAIEELPGFEVVFFDAEGKELGTEAPAPVPAPAPKAAAPAAPAAPAPKAEAPAAPAAPAAAPAPAAEGGQQDSGESEGLTREQIVELRKTVEGMTKLVDIRKIVADYALELPAGTGNTFKEVKAAVLKLIDAVLTDE